MEEAIQTEKIFVRLRQLLKVKYFLLCFSRSVAHNDYKT